MARELIDEIITLINSEANNNPPPKSCKIVKTYEDSYCDVEVENLGILIHKKTIGTPEIGLEGIICFLNGDLNEGIVITSTIIEEVDLSPILNDLAELNETKSDINHLHSQYLTEHQDLSNYANRAELNNSLAMKVGYGDLFDLIYPVGSIYMSVNEFDPAHLFGGTWVQIKDKFLLASGESYSNGSSGGSADAVVVSHNHTQNSHNHSQNAHSHSPGSGRSFLTAPSGSGWLEIQGANISGSGYHYVATGDSSNYNVYTQGSGSATASNNAATATNNSTGVDGTGKNMPPYLAVNVWQRTA